MQQALIAQYARQFPISTAQEAFELVMERLSELLTENKCYERIIWLAIKCKDLYSLLKAKFLPVARAQLPAVGAVKYKLVYQMKIFQDQSTPHSQGFEYSSATTTKQMVGCICREHCSDSFGSWCRGSKVHHIAKIDNSCHNLL